MIEKKITTPDKEVQRDKRLLGRIAALNGIDVRDISGPELQRVYMTGDPKLYDKYIGPIHTGSKTQQLDQLTESLFDIRATLYSYGLFQPTYEHALRNQKRKKELKTDKEPTHTSLLVGALTPDTVNEYDAIVKKVYPRSTTIVLDLFKEHGGPSSERFIQGNALAMPLEDGSVDSVHTNVLLKDLAVSRSPLDEETRGKHQPKFYDEVSRILRPEGIVVFVEKKDDAKKAKKELKERGMQDVIERPARRFVYRRDLVGFMEGEEVQGPYVKGRGIHVVTAKKT